MNIAIPKEKHLLHSETDSHLLGAADLFFGIGLHKEYRIADLYGRTIRQRAKQLSGIAHPDFGIWDEI